MLRSSYVASFKPFSVPFLVVVGI